MPKCWAQLRLWPFNFKHDYFLAGEIYKFTKNISSLLNRQHISSSKWKLVKIMWCKDAWGSCFYKMIHHEAFWKCCILSILLFESHNLSFFTYILFQDFQVHYVHTSALSCGCYSLCALEACFCSALAELCRADKNMLRHGSPRPLWKSI